MRRALLWLAVVVAWCGMFVLVAATEKLDAQYDYARPASARGTK